MNLAGDEWRIVGIVALARELAKGSGARSKWKVSVSEPEDQIQAAPVPLLTGAVRCMVRCLCG